MKSIVFICALIVCTGLNAQQSTCCSAPEAFTAFANDEAFVKMHEAPLPFHFISEKGKMISFPCSDGKDASAFSIQSKDTSNKYLFVFHEWWGLNDYIKQEAEKLYTDLGGHVNVIALDLYDGKIATDADSAKKIMKQTDIVRVMTIVAGAQKMIGDNMQIATIGWCMGGGYSLQASIHLQQQGIACVMFYGMPESDLTKLRQLNADVLMIWATQDKWITSDIIENFKKNMLDAGKKLKVEEYDADHAFANPSNPHYNKELSAEAYEKSIRFLREELNLQ